MEALAVEKLRGASLLMHYSGGNDFRAPWRVAHPLPEVLLPIVCGTIAAGGGILTVIGKAMRYNIYRSWRKGNNSQNEAASFIVFNNSNQK